MWTAVPFLVAAVGMIAVATHSDRTGERRRHVAGCAALAAAGLASSSLTDAPIVALAALAVGAIGLYSATPPFWSLPTAFLRGDGAAAGIGLINSVGNLGGFVGPYLMGWMQGASGDFRLGLRVLAASAMCSGIVVLTMKTRSAESLALHR
jgi:MFS family permease